MPSNFLTTFLPCRAGPAVQERIYVLLVRINMAWFNKVPTLNVKNDSIVLSTDDNEIIEYLSLSSTRLPDDLILCPHILLTTIILHCLDLISSGHIIWTHVT